MTLNHALREQWRLRAARDEDAERIRELIVISGDSQPEFPWPVSQSAARIVDLAKRRAAKRAQNFAVKNSLVVQSGGQVAGVMLGYRVSRKLDAIRQGLLPPYLRPTMDVETLCPASFYVNTLALFPAFQNRGLGAQLLAGALVKARAYRCRSMTLEVALGNEQAHHVYSRHGFEAVARFSGIPAAEPPYDKDFVLMRRSFDYPRRTVRYQEEREWLSPHSTL